MGISIAIFFMLWATVLAIPWSSDDHNHHGDDNDCHNHGYSAHATPVQGIISQGTSCPGFPAPPGSDDDESNPGVQETLPFFPPHLNSRELLKYLDAMLKSENTDYP